LIEEAENEKQEFDKNMQTVNQKILEEKANKLIL